MCIALVSGMSEYLVFLEAWAILVAVISEDREEELWKWRKGNQERKGWYSLLCSIAAGILEEHLLGTGRATLALEGSLASSILPGDRMASYLSLRVPAILYVTSFASNTLCSWCDPRGTRVESVWRHCLLYDPLESKRQSHTPVRVTPRSSQGIHRSRAGKPGIEGSRLTRVYVLCGEQGKIEGEEEEGFELTLITAVIMMVYLQRQNPHDLITSHCSTCQHLSWGLCCFSHLSFGEHINTIAQCLMFRGHPLESRTFVMLSGLKVPSFDLKIHITWEGDFCMHEAWVRSFIRLRLGFTQVDCHHGASRVT